ncbi:unnamed protein product [Medioppia subpectinata]|uniref:Uncharacterized protein n=1 Tax=Medioppia subpectinata TaxID=1979941 RepID=A0A7R9PVK6_9ACAR|nr:unnamed protein product [Medioppia subpectinata]CAG2102946.1 unnamed protein product [Medioppia subpectinata]
MTTNPILVLISMNTLCPEVEDYWLSIPPTVKTIDDLKRHILTTESIDRSADDIGLYLESALLRDHISIAGIKDRDYIEIRVKCWISSSVDNTSEHKRCQSSDTECITIDDSDDDMVGNGSDVSALKRTQSLAPKTTEELIDEIKSSPIESTQEVTELESQAPSDSPYSPSSPIYPTGEDECNQTSLKDMYAVSSQYGLYDWPSRPNTSTPLTAYRGDKVVTQSSNECSAKGMDITRDHSYGGTNLTDNKHVFMDYVPYGDPLYGKPIATDSWSPSHSSTAFAVDHGAHVVTQSGSKCFAKDLLMDMSAPVGSKSVDMSYGQSSPAIATVRASDGSAQWDEESCNGFNPLSPGDQL